MKIKEAIYHQPLRKLFVDTLIKRKLSNRIVGKFADSRASTSVIKEFERAYNINRSLFKKPHQNGFHTLNEFFTREYIDQIIAEAFPNNPKADLHSPAEGFLSIQTEINPASVIQAKRFTYSLIEFLGTNAEKYNRGTMMKIRLTPREYHHIHYADNGIITAFRDIKGNYYTSDHPGTDRIRKVYCKSHRHITEIKTENFGRVTYAEIGATFVGTIIQNNNLEDSVQYGDKKSMFKFGGSTLILLFEKGRLNLNKRLDELANSDREIYTGLGEVLGRRL
jgi:phosphatidylserine decarboxylase